MIPNLRTLLLRTSLAALVATGLASVQARAQGIGGALPVVDEGRLSGILTSADLLDHCLHTLWEPEGIPPRR